MQERLITFVIDGPSEFEGQIPADDFLAKLRDFIAMIYSFERAYYQRPKRSMTLDLVDLRKSSPARAVFRARAMVNGLDASKPVAWAADQLRKIYANDDVDQLVGDSQLEAVVNFAHRKSTKLRAVRLIQVEFGGLPIEFDDKMELQALRLRNDRIMDMHQNWYAGVSKGSLFGELRSVSDIEGERRFVICPPTGPDYISCVFPEELRLDAKNNLFKVVKVHGFLHYDGRSPHAARMDAERIEGVQESNAHLSDYAGMFTPFEDNVGDDHWPTM